MEFLVKKVKNGFIIEQDVDGEVVHEVYITRQSLFKALKQLVPVSQQDDTERDE